MKRRLRHSAGSTALPTPPPAGGLPVGMRASRPASRRGVDEIQDEGIAWTMKEGISLWSSGAAGILDPRGTSSQVREESRSFNRFHASARTAIQPPCRCTTDAHGAPSWPRAHAS
jgi:hypothetical protein